MSLPGSYGSSRGSLSDTSFGGVGESAPASSNLAGGTTHRARVVVHKIIAMGDYVWTHVNLLNLTTDDPQDTGIAGVDIFKMDAEGRAIEHWDVLKVVGGPNNAVPWFAPNVPAAITNGMF